MYNYSTLHLVESFFKRVDPGKCLSDPKSSGSTAPAWHVRQVRLGLWRPTGMPTSMTHGAQIMAVQAVVSG